MPNTRSKVNLEASEKRRRQGLDDELWRHINMLGQTGRDLEKTKRKTQQGDKPRLNSNGTQDRREKRNQEWSSLCGLHYSLNTQQYRVRMSHMLPVTEVDDKDSDTHRTASIKRHHRVSDTPGHIRPPEFWKSSYSPACYLHTAHINHHTWWLETAWRVVYCQFKTRKKKKFHSTCYFNTFKKVLQYHTSSFACYIPFITNYITFIITAKHCANNVAVFRINVHSQLTKSRGGSYEF